MADIMKDDASDWYASMGQEIQDYEVPPMPEAETTAEDQAAAEEAEYLEEHPYAEAPRVTSEDACSVLNMQRIQRPTASVIVGVMDTVLPILIALVVKGSEAGALKLDAGERDTLTDAWAAYLGDKNVQASPGAVLLTTIATIYGAKVFMAFQQRKDARLAEENDALRAELLKAQQQAAEAEARAATLAEKDKDKKDKD